MIDNTDSRRSSTPRSLTHVMAMRVLRLTLAGILGLQGLAFAVAPSARVELATAQLPVILAIGIGGIEFIAAVMLLRVALTTVAVVLLLGTIVAAIAIHIALGQYTFFHLLYAAAALIAVATYSREQRSV